MAYVGGVVLACLLAACGIADDDQVLDDRPEMTSGDLADGDGAAREVESGVDLCQPEVVGTDIGTTVVIHLVENGQLGSACYGSPLAVVEESWLALAEITPPEQLDAVVVFAGFEARSGDETIAFAAPVPREPRDPDSEVFDGQFVIAVDIPSAEEDDVELLVTMAHEISHVFTQLPDQLDRFADTETCDTFYNGAGCFADDALVTAWIEQFWTADELASLPDDGSADVDGGSRRCSLDPAFIGSYGASHPEEDFAESFAAYVFGVGVSPQSDDRIAFFDDYPELVAFRDRAAAADLDQLNYTFDRCG